MRLCRLATLLRGWLGVPVREEAFAIATVDCLLVVHPVPSLGAQTPSSACAGLGSTLAKVTRNMHNMIVVLNSGVRDVQGSFTDGKDTGSLASGYFAHIASTGESDDGGDRAVLTVHLAMAAGATGRVSSCAPPRCWS